MTVQTPGRVYHIGGDDLVALPPANDVGALLDAGSDLEVLGTWSSQYATHVRYAVKGAGHEHAPS